MSKISNQKISILLQKYWEGETTLQEEETLVSFFNESESLAPEYQVIKPLFLAKSINTEPNISEHFDVKILHHISNNNPDLSEIKKIKAETIKQRKVIRQLRWYTSIAASVAILLITYIIMDNTKLNNVISQTERVSGSLSSVEKKEAIKAYKQTKAALFFVSSKMKQGTDKATKSLNKLSEFETMLEEVEY